jgi:hypothetical protein
MWTMAGDGWLMVTVRKVGVVLLAILTTTANHTKRNLQQLPGMTCERSTPYSVLAPVPVKEDRSWTCF